MWAYGIVVAPPDFDENLGLFEGVEDLPPHSPDGCRFGPVQVHDILAMTMG